MLIASDGIGNFNIKLLGPLNYIPDEMNLYWAGFTAKNLGIAPEKYVGEPWIQKSSENIKWPHLIQA